MKKTTSRFALALSFISFLFYLTPDDSAEASSAPPVSDVTILGPGTWAGTVWEKVTRHFGRVISTWQFKSWDTGSRRHILTAE